VLNLKLSIILINGLRLTLNIIVNRHLLYVKSGRLHQSLSELKQTIIQYCQHFCSSRHLHIFKVLRVKQYCDIFSDQVKNQTQKADDLRT